MPEGWDREILPPEWTKPQVDGWVAEFFDRELDDIGNTPDLDLIRTAWQIAQKQSKQRFHSFDERENCSRRSCFEKQTLAERAFMVKRKARQLPD
jgi:hypothetical protein